MTETVSKTENLTGMKEPTEVAYSCKSKALLSAVETLGISPYISAKVNRVCLTVRSHCFSYLNPELSPLIARSLMQPMKLIISDSSLPIIPKDIGTRGKKVGSA